jgi:hypothetical protein
LINDTEDDGLCCRAIDVYTRMRLLELGIQSPTPFVCAVIRRDGQIFKTLVTSFSSLVHFVESSGPDDGTAYHVGGTEDADLLAEAVRSGRDGAAVH